MWGNCAKVKKKDFDTPANADKHTNKTGLGEYWII